MQVRRSSQWLSKSLLALACGLPPCVAASVAPTAAASMPDRPVAPGATGGHTDRGPRTPANPPWIPASLFPLVILTGLGGAAWILAEFAERRHNQVPVD